MPAPGTPAQQRPISSGPSSSSTLRRSSDLDQLQQDPQHQQADQLRRQPDSVQPQHDEQSQPRANQQSQHDSSPAQLQPDPAHSHDAQPLSIEDQPQPEDVPAEILMSQRMKDRGSQTTV